jgi:carbon storage regulator
MLVLSRKPGEAVVIGGNIEVTVLDVHGDRVKLGLCGPAEVPFRREEVCQAYLPRSLPNHSICRRGQNVNRWAAQ